MKENTAFYKGLFATILIYIIGLIALVFYYKNESIVFSENLKNAVVHNDTQYIEKYEIATFEDHDINRIDSEGLYETFKELNYEWDVLKDSISHIKSIDIEKINSSINKRFPFFSSYSCYKIVFNEIEKNKMMICTEQFFTNVKIIHLFYDYRLIN